jgi:hypothetical protein
MMMTTTELNCGKHTSPAKSRGLKPSAEHGASRRTRSKLLGKNPFDFSTLPPEQLLLPGPFFIRHKFFLRSALLTYLLDSAFWSSNKKELPFQYKEKTFHLV